MMLRIECRCGRLLSYEGEEDEALLFCDDCYLNHKVKVKEGRPVVILQYYFPDD